VAEQALAADDLSGCCDQFRSLGYTVVPQLVGKAACDRALRLINHHLGREGSRQTAPGLHGLGAEFLPEHDAAGPEGVVKLGSLALHPLLNHGLLGTAECETIGRALQLPATTVQTPVGAQLALRFPLPPLSAELEAEGQQAADADTLEGLLGRLTWHTDTDKYNDRKSFDFVVGTLS